MKRILLSLGLFLAFAFPAPAQIMLGGSGAPVASSGSEGQFYFNTVNGNIYGPKAFGAWPSPTAPAYPTGSAAGSTLELQYNNAGAFGGTSGLTWDNTNGVLTLDRGSGNSFELRDRAFNDSVPIGFGVPSFRSATTNTSTAFDIMPNGTSTLAWMDICNSDISPPATSEWQCFIMQSSASGLALGSHTNGGILPQLPLSIGGLTIEFRSNAIQAGTSYLFINNIGTFFRAAGTDRMLVTDTDIRLGSGMDFRWTNDPEVGVGSFDTGIARNAAGVVEINAGTPGALATLLSARNTITGGTVTASTPLESGTQTWDSVGTAFSLLDFDVTDTNSATSSTLINLKVGGVSKFSVSRLGVATVPFMNASSAVQVTSNTGTVNLGSNGDTKLGWGAAADLRLGDGAAASPIAQTLSVQSVLAGTSNTAGASWTQKASLSTGSGIGGSLVFQTSAANAAATTQNVGVTTLTLMGSATTTANPGRILAAGQIESSGSQPTAAGSGGTCATGAIAGGANAGTVTLTGVCAATNTITLTFLSASTTGWACDATDRNAPASLIQETSTSTTTAVLTVAGTTGATDVIQYKCTAY